MIGYPFYFTKGVFFCLTTVHTLTCFNPSTTATCCGEVQLHVIVGVRKQNNPTRVKRGSSLSKECFDSREN